MKPEDENGQIQCVQHLMNLMERVAATASRHAHKRWWFRGQSDWSWSLHPAVYRSKFNAKDEEDRLLKEQHLTQDFQVESAGLRSGVDDAELYFLEQHYGMPTRLLDWTTSPLAALFFAVCENPGLDGAFFVMDAYQLAQHQELGGVPFRGIATSRHEVFKIALQPIFHWKKVQDLPKFIIPVRPDHFRSTCWRPEKLFYIPRSRTQYPYCEREPYPTMSQNSPKCKTDRYKRIVSTRD